VLDRSEKGREYGRRIIDTNSNVLCLDYITPKARRE
jgi:hypothetical protein